MRESTRSSQAPDAACGCCPADRAAQRCCCSHRAHPAEDLPPCCRGKSAAPHTVTWVHPSLRAKCIAPDDTAPGSVLPVSIPPATPAGWCVLPDEAGFVAPVTSILPSRSVPPDDPPPRGR